MKRLLLTLLAVVVGLVVHATDYKLVTDVSQLEVGARYLVVGTNTKGTYAMGNLKKDNHYAIPVEITVPRIIPCVKFPDFSGYLILNRTIVKSSSFGS